MSDWRLIDRTCKHCGQFLEARPALSDPVVLTGWEPMEYRHKGGGVDCPPVVTRAAPYDHCNVYRDYLSGDEG